MRSIPLPRVNGWIEMGGASAIVGGVALGWSVVEGPLAGHAIAVLLGLNLLVLLTALPVWFPSDVLRPEAPARGDRRLLPRRACVSAGSRPPSAACSAWPVFRLSSRPVPGRSSNKPSSRELHEGFLQALAMSMLGAGLGCLTASGQGHPQRCLGLVPLGATGLLLALGWATLAIAPEAALPLIPCFVLGFMGGLVNVPLRAVYQAAVPADARQRHGDHEYRPLRPDDRAGPAPGRAVRAEVLRTPVAQLAYLAILSGAGAAVAWWYLMPLAVEQLVELLLTPMYRVRVRGPGRELIPRRDRSSSSPITPLISIRSGFARSCRAG